MTYKAKNVDTDKALDYLRTCIQAQYDKERLETTSTMKYYEGVRKGLEIGEGIFECSNYEKKKESTYTDGVLKVIYELGKELDIPTNDLRENYTTVDDICAELAKRIKEAG